MTIIDIADLVSPSDVYGRTYRQINAAKSHTIPVGSLVECGGSDDSYRDGIRLFVVHHGRDCDQTPLYYLSADPDDTKEERPGFRNASWYGGVPEQYLTVVRPPQEPG